MTPVLSAQIRSVSVPVEGWGGDDVLDASSGVMPNTSTAMPFTVSEASHFVPLCRSRRGVSGWCEPRTQEHEVQRVYRGG